MDCLPVLVQELLRRNRGRRGEKRISGGVRYYNVTTACNGWPTSSLNRLTLNHDDLQAQSSVMWTINEQTQQTQWQRDHLFPSTALSLSIFHLLLSWMWFLHIELRVLKRNPRIHRERKTRMIDKGGLLSGRWREPHEQSDALGRK